jgi:hypothetical protein
MQSLFALFAIVSLASATGVSPLFPRQSGSYVPCSQQVGVTACGSEYNCIPDSYTCCPDGSGGCPPTEYCGVGSNGKYGCCPNGEICSGDGGASTGLGVASQTAPAVPQSSYGPAPEPSSTPYVPAPSPSSPESPSSPSSPSSPDSPSWPESASHHTGGASTNQLALDEMSIFGSFLIGLLPALLG